MNYNEIATSEAFKLSAVGKMPKKSSQESKAISLLNDLLANEYTLFTKTLNYHWNITGPNFVSLHKLLDEQYHQLLEILDQVAERIRILGAHPISTIKEMQKETSLSENPGDLPAAEEMIEELFRDNLFVQQQIKSFLKNDKILESDPGTEDFLINLLRKHEMSSWILKSHL
jgi:starvation-inducible DNA-binding protein